MPLDAVNTGPSEPSPLIAALDLAPHPEGGWFRETWRVPYAIEVPDGRQRPPATAILFLLCTGESSAWHRVASDEVWLAQIGAITLELGGTGATPESAEQHVVGLDIEGGQSPQVVVPADTWQRTLAVETDTLVSCVVAPGFDFADFELG